MEITGETEMKRQRIREEAESLLNELRLMEKETAISHLLEFMDMNYKSLIRYTIGDVVFYKGKKKVDQILQLWKKDRKV